MYGAIADVEASGFDEQHRALLRFVRKLNDEAAKIGEADIAGLHAVGWTDEAIYDAVAVCGLFNFYNRWIDGTGVHPMPDEAHRASGRRMALHGYSRGSDE